MRIQLRSSFARHRLRHLCKCWNDHKHFGWRTDVAVQSSSGLIRQDVSDFFFLTLMYDAKAWKALGSPEVVITHTHPHLVQNYKSQILELRFPSPLAFFKQATGPCLPPPPPQTSPSTQVREFCQKQPNAKHSQQRSRESKLWEGTRLTSEWTTCEKFLPNYWECTGSL